MIDILGRILLILVILLIVACVITIPIWFIWNHYLFMSVVSMIALLPAVGLIKIVIEDF